MEEGTPDVLATYVRSLKELRQDIGCTPERLTHHPELLTALKRLMRRQIDVTVEACIEELRRVVLSLSDQKYRDALLVALRLNSEYLQATVSSRRERFNEDLKKSQDVEVRRLCVDNLRTLERRENHAIELVSKKLSEAFDGRFGKVYSPKQLAVPSNPPIRELATESMVYRCYFSATGAVTKMEVTRRVKALTANADPQVRASHRYYSERRKGVLKIRPVVGCRLVGIEEGAAGAIVSRLEIFRRLSPEDGAYYLSYDVEVNSTRTAEPILEWEPRGGTVEEQQVREIVMHLIFDPQMTPVRAWWFQTQNAARATIEPDVTAGYHLDILNDGQYIYKTFDAEGEILPTALHGVTWIWPSML